MNPGPLTDAAAKARARADSIRYPYTHADIHFMTGMIVHHAQAVLISKWAPSHGASPELLRLTSRIINSQRDEILLMQRWLADRGQHVPMVAASGKVLGVDSLIKMPGLLSDEQLAELDKARGTAFDELFLRDMIGHHSGAVAMVDKLFATDAAAQDQLTFKFANDVQADQRTEIARMQRMLANILFSEGDR